MRRAEIAASSQPKKDWKRILPGLIISLISLGIAFYFADWRKVLIAIRQADYTFIALGYLTGILWLLARGFVWRTLLQEKATYSQVFFTLNEGYLLNNILPFRLGEIGRSLLLAEKANLRFLQVFSTVIIERGMDVGMAAGLLLVTIPFVVGGTWAKNAALVAGALVIIGFSAMYLLARNSHRATAWFDQATVRWSVLNRLGHGQLHAFLDGLEVITDAHRFLRAILWDLVNWGIAILQYYLFMLAFFPEGKLLWSSFALGISSLGIAAPSSPGSLGVFELVVVGALSVIGLDPAKALAMALVTHSANYVLTGILGAYGLAQDGETITGLYHRLRQFSQGVSANSD